MWFLKILNVELAYDAASPLLGVSFPKEMKAGTLGATFPPTLVTAPCPAAQGKGEPSVQG